MHRNTIGAAALAAGLLLAGCSSNDTTSTTSTPSPSASESHAEPSGASTMSADFELDHFWVKESSLDMSAGFGKIINEGSQADALVGVTAPGVPEIELHETVDGVMQQVQSFPIPAGGTLELQPGGNHLMFMGLTQPLKVGESIDLTLKFESGKTATINAPIEPFTGDDGHGDM